MKHAHTGALVCYDEEQYAACLSALRAYIDEQADRNTSDALLPLVVAKFLHWVDKPLPAFSLELEGEDKFAELIGLARQNDAVASFFVFEFQISPSTVWRWAYGQSRPSKLVGVQVAQEVERRLAHALCAATQQ